MSTENTVEQVEKNTESFTLDEAKAKLEAEQEAKQAANQARLQEFVDLVLAAQEKTGCTLQVDINSTLSDLRVIPVINPEADYAVD